MGPTADLPTPVPVIEKLHVNGGGETACIDITGKNFTPKLKVSPLLKPKRNRTILLLKGLVWKL